MIKFFGKNMEDEVRGVCSLQNAGQVKRDLFFRWLDFTASQDLDSWNATQRHKYFLNYLRDASYLRKWKDYRAALAALEQQILRARGVVAGGDNATVSTLASGSVDKNLIMDAHTAAAASVALPSAGKMSESQQSHPYDAEQELLQTSVALWDRKSWFSPQRVKLETPARKKQRQHLKSIPTAVWAESKESGLTIKQYPPARVTRDSVRFCPSFVDKDIDDKSGKIKEIEEIRRKHHHRSLKRLREIGVPDHLKNGRFLNFGCGRCDDEDPLWEFFDKGKDADVTSLSKGKAFPKMKGYGYELDPVDAAACVENAGDFVDVVVAGVTPESIDQQMDETGYFAATGGEEPSATSASVASSSSSSTGSAPDEQEVNAKKVQNQVDKTIKNPQEPNIIEIVKIDIDSWDYEIAEKVERKARKTNTKVMIYVLEIQGVFPPPIRFWSKYAPRAEKTIESHAASEAEKLKKTLVKTEDMLEKAMEHLENNEDATSITLEQIRIAAALNATKDASTTEKDAASLSATNLRRFRELALRKNHPHFIGASLQAFVDLLRPTHSLIMMNGMDAVFVENSLVRDRIQQAYQIYLPVDEELCFSLHQPWHSWREEYIGDWIYGGQSWREKIEFVKKNMTMCDPHWDNPTKEAWPYGVKAPKFHVGI
ncbi:unnamed protein product [Amoebophrya sp. A120]|nr:unnamed protein product [Amoebophrya sp. A120]|eukprot:GSA120T00012848001.1